MPVLITLSVLLATYWKHENKIYSYPAV